MVDRTAIRGQIDDARERAAMYTGGPEASRLWALADTVESLLGALDASGDAPE